MILSDLEFYLISVPRRQASMPTASLLVRLATNTGIDGWGETPAVWRRDELAARREALLPILAGRSIFDIEDLLGLEALQSASLCSAVEMASWDLIGRVAGQPLCRLFGGEYRRRVPIAVRLVGDSTDQLAAYSRELADQGMHGQILSATGDARVDRARLAAIGGSAAERVELRLDGNAGYSLETAKELLADMEDHRIQCIVDPLKSRDTHEIATLRRQTNVPVAVCRSIQAPADVVSVVRGGAADLVIIDLNRVGGISQARKCAAVAEAAGISAALRGGFSLGMQTAAMLQTAASTPAFALRNESMPPHLGDDVLAEPLEVADGMIAAPLRPGLGIEIDRSKLERYQIS